MRLCCVYMVYVVWQVKDYALFFPRRSSHPTDPFFPSLTAISQLNYITPPADPLQGRLNDAPPLLFSFFPFFPSSNVVNKRMGHTGEWATFLLHIERHFFRPQSPISQQQSIRRRWIWAVFQNVYIVGWLIHLPNILVRYQTCTWSTR